MIGLFSNEFPTPAMEFNPSFANSKVAQRSLEGFLVSGMIAYNWITFGRQIFLSMHEPSYDGCESGHRLSYRHT